VCAMPQRGHRHRVAKWTYPHRGCSVRKLSFGDELFDFRRRSNGPQRGGRHALRELPLGRPNLYRCDCHDPSRPPSPGNRRLRHVPLIDEHLHRSVATAGQPHPDLAAVQPMSFEPGGFQHLYNESHGNHFRVCELPRCRPQLRQHGAADAQGISTQSHSNRLAGL